MDYAGAVLRGKGENLEPPYVLAHAWQWFVELCGGRRGQEPLAYADIAAWSGLTLSMPRPDEVALIKRLDAVWLEVVNEKTRKASGQPAVVEPKTPEEVRAHQEALKAQIRGLGRR